MIRCGGRSDLDIIDVIDIDIRKIIETKDKFVAEKISS